MQRVALPSLGALGVAVMFGVIGSAQGVPPVTLNVKPAAAVDVVLYTAANSGTVLGRTDQTGTVTLDFLKIANAGKIGKVTVIEEKCPDETKLLLASADAQLPAPRKDCRRRRVGAFILGQDTVVNVKLTGGGGVTTATKAELAGGAAAVGAILIAKHGGSDQTTPSNPGSPTVTALQGTFNISATKNTDTGCNFSSSFTGQVQVSGNADGTSQTIRMIERLTRVYSGTLQTTGTYSGTGTGNLDGFQYSGTITGQISSDGRTIQGIETLNFSTGCPNRVVAYQFSGSK